MKKSTLSALVAYLNANPIAELADATADLNAEFEKNEAKAQANRDLYESAHDAVMTAITDTPRTVTEIFEACKDSLPVGFSRSKLQYAIREYWGSEVDRHENGKEAYTYTKV